jgi:hypothetical protein
MEQNQFSYASVLQALSILIDRNVASLPPNRDKAERMRSLWVGVASPARLAIAQAFRLGPSVGSLHCFMTRIVE